jgi:cation:H+ antiporter
MTTVGWLGLAALGTGAIVWGADTFAEHLSVAATRLGVSAFALAILLAGAEPEELATAVTASLRKAPAIALGDVIGANIAICLVAIGVGAVIAPLPFDRRVRRYALAGIPAGALAAAIARDGHVSRLEGLVLIGCYAQHSRGDGSTSTRRDTLALNAPYRCGIVLVPFASRRMPPS